MSIPIGEPSGPGALSAEQLAWLRSEVGNTPTDAELQDRYTRLGSVRDVAVETLRARRASLLDGPLSVNIPGVASVSQAENVKAIERRLAGLAGLDDDPTDEAGEDVDGGSGRSVEVVQLHRSRGR